MRVNPPVQRARRGVSPEAIVFVSNGASRSGRRSSGVRARRALHRHRDVSTRQLSGHCLQNTQPVSTASKTMASSEVASSQAS